MHLSWSKRGDDRPDPPLGHGLGCDRSSRHTLETARPPWRVKLAGNVSHRPGNRRHGQSPKYEMIELARQNNHRDASVPAWRICTSEPLPFHSFPHACSLSHTLNSVAFTGRWRSPFRCLRSCSATRCLWTASPQGIPGESRPRGLQLFASLSTSSTSRSSSVICNRSHGVPPHVAHMLYYPTLMASSRRGARTRLR